MNTFVHTCVRVLDSDRSQAFYELLGFEYRGRFQFETAYNIYMGLPGGGDTLELTVNLGRTDPYDLGDGYNHIAITVPDLDALLAQLAAHDIHPEKPAFHPGGREEYRIAFVQDPDGCRTQRSRSRVRCVPNHGRLRPSQSRLRSKACVGRLSLQGDPALKHPALG